MNFLSGPHMEYLVILSLYKVNTSPFFDKIDLFLYTGEVNRIFIEGFFKGVKHNILPLIFKPSLVRKVKTVPGIDNFKSSINMSLKKPYSLRNLYLISGIFFPQCHKYEK